MNWNRAEEKTLKCPFELETDEAYNWFIQRVGDRSIRWTLWIDPSYTIQIKLHHTNNSYFEDHHGTRWDIAGGFEPNNGCEYYWEFADELEQRR